MGNFATLKIKLKDLVSPQLGKMSKRFNVTKKQFKTTALGMSGNIKGLAKSIKSVPQINVHSTQPVKALDRIERKAESLDKKGGKSLQSFKSKAKGLGSLGRAFQGKGVSSLGNSLRFAGAGLNPVVAGLGLAAVGAYKLGEAVVTSSIKMQKNLEITSGYIGGNTAETKELTAQATALSNVYGSDYADTVKTASLVSKRFGLENKAAFDLIQKGFASGANIDGGLLKSLEEHSDSFKTLGSTASQQIAILQQSTSKGIKDVPKLLESFGTKLPKLGGDVQRLLDNSFGANFTSGLKERLASGQTTALDALKSISTAVANTPLADGAAKSLASQVFGDSSENAVQLLTNFSSYETSLDKLVSKNGTFNKVKMQQYKLEKQIAGSQLQNSKRVTEMSDKVTLLGLSLKATFYNNLGGILDFTNKVQRFGSSLYSLANKIGLVKAGTGILNHMFSRITGVLDLVSDGMDFISNKTGGAAPPKRRGFKNEGFEESRFVKSFDRFGGKDKNSPLMLSMLDLNKTTKDLAKTNRSGKSAELFSTTQDTENKGLSNSSQSSLSSGINSIVAGGTQTRNLSINIEKMSGIENLYSTVDESKGDIEDKLRELLVKVIQGTEFALNKG